MLFTFYIQGVLKLKKNSGAERLTLLLETKMDTLKTKCGSGGKVDILGGSGIRPCEKEFIQTCLILSGYRWLKHQT